MTHLAKRVTSAVLACMLVLSLMFGLMPTAVTAVSGTGYTKSEDVVYNTSGKYTANWGYRGETCSFLSPYANNFYTDDYSYETLSSLDGGSGTADAPYSDLYTALQELMVDNHSTQTSYGDTRYQYMYTDCQLSNTSTILSFYSGTALDSTWDSGKTWNREHTWPASKSLSGRPGSSSKGEGADIMMLRPAATSENGSRGNKAYGLSSGYYIPDASVRGDCARILLYTYVRWGNTTNMWGSNGVIESLDILLQWMEEDPVDTWEMGRNDAVQSITGTRNVFVDYPEYAWLLFGLDVPEGITTPSRGIGTDITPSVPTEPEETQPEETAPTEAEPEPTQPEEPCTDTTYVKVTQEQEDWSGTYLFTYTTTDDQAYIFNGTDAEGNYSIVNVTDNTITGTASVDGLTIVIEKCDDDYYIKVGDQYIGGKSGKNSIVFSGSKVLNTIVYENGAVTVTSNGVILRFNASKVNGDRFRYYKVDNTKTDDTYPRLTLYRLEIATTDPVEPTEPLPTEPEPTEPKPTEPEPTEPEPTEPEPTEPEPTEPEPTEPEPTEPEPTEPEPTEPEPTEPEPTEPEPTEPEPTEPEPTEPEPTEPEPTEPEPTEPEPTEPEPTEPEPTEPEPTEPEHTEPEPTEPEPTEPEPTEPEPTEPEPTEPEPTEPKPTEPEPTEPEPTEPEPTEPEPTEPEPTEPEPTEPKEPVIMDIPTVDTAFNLRIDKGDTTYYFNGQISGENTSGYLGTTDDISKAVEVFVEQCGDGYKLYFIQNSAARSIQKTYICIYKDGDEVKFCIDRNSAHYDENGTIFNWDAENMTFTTEVEGEQYFIGATNSDSLGATPVSEMTQDSVSHLYTFASDSNGTPDNDDTTPTEPDATEPTEPDGTTAPTEPEGTAAPTEPDDEATVPTEPDGTEPTAAAPTPVRTIVLIALIVVISAAAIGGCIVLLFVVKKKSGE